MSNEIRYTIGIDGARQTEQVLRGLRAQAVETEKAVGRGTNARPGVAAGASPQARALEQQKRAVENFEKWRRNEEARTARERDMHARAAVQSERQAATGRLQAIQQFATRAISIYQTVSQRASALSGAFGGRSREAMLGENMNLQIGMRRLARDSGVDRAVAQRQILAASRASGIDPSQLLAAMQSHGGGDAATAAMLRSAPEIARHAQAVGTDASNVTSVLGQALRMGLREENISGFLNQYTGLVTSQNVSPEALAGKLGAAFATYGTATGTTGEEAVLGAMRLQGTIGAALGGGDRAVGSGYESVMGLMQDEGFQRRLRRSTGTTGTVDNLIGGTVANPLQTLQTIQASGALTTREQFAQLAGSSDAGETLRTIVEAMRTNGSAMQDVLGASGQAGAAYTRDVMGDLGGVAGFGNQANQMANFVENGQTFASYADHMADGVDTLNSKFPMMVEGLDHAASGIERLTENLGNLAMATGGGAALAGGGGAAVGGGGLLGGGALTGGGALAGGSALTIAGGAAVVGIGAGLTYQRRQEAMATSRTIRDAQAQRLGLVYGGRDAEADQIDVTRTLTEGAQREQQRRTEIGAFLSGGAPAAPPAAPAGGNGAGQGGRPLIVSLDRASADSLARSFATQQAAITARGEPERR